MLRCWWWNSCSTRTFFAKHICAGQQKSLFCNSPVPHTVLLDMIGKDIPGDPLAVERTTLLYNLCWFTLKSYGRKDTRFFKQHLSIYLSMNTLSCLCKWVWRLRTYFLLLQIYWCSLPSCNVQTCNLDVAHVCAGYFGLVCYSWYFVGFTWVLFPRLWM